MGRAGGKLVAGGQSPTSVVVGGSIKKRLNRGPAGVDCVISSVAIGRRQSFAPYPPIDHFNPFSLDGSRFFTNSPLAFLSKKKTHLHARRQTHRRKPEHHRLWQDFDSLQTKIPVCERP